MVVLFAQLLEMETWFSTSTVVMYTLLEAACFIFDKAQHPTNYCKVCRTSNLSNGDNTLAFLVIGGGVD
jgi:hypothetical protein